MNSHLEKCFEALNCVYECVILHLVVQPDKGALVSLSVLVPLVNFNLIVKLNLLFYRFCLCIAYIIDMTVIFVTFAGFAINTWTMCRAVFESEKQFRQ